MAVDENRNIEEHVHLSSDAERKASINESQKSRIQRALTQRYDMHSLRHVQQLENVFNASVAKLYNCEEDELPFDIDTLEIFRSPPTSRRSLLVIFFDV
jgi:hypothetical protein